MKLLETEFKEILSKAGVWVPKGRVVSTAEEAEAAAKELGPVVLKVLGKKRRGKAGLIKFAETPEQARLFTEELLKKSEHGVLVEEKIPIKEEIYVAYAIDFSSRKPVLIVSRKGGVDIEETAAGSPEQVGKFTISILNGIDQNQADEASGFLGYQLSGFLKNLYKQFRKLDAELLEINPLAVTENGVCAVDALIEINDDSLDRHQEFREKKGNAKDSIAVQMAAQGWSYHDLGGDIGLICSGAGLSMATLDLMQIFGGRPANFLDMAQVDGDGIYRGLEILSKKDGIRSILISLFAGLNRCDSMAEGIARFVRENGQKVPIVVRMVGNGEDDGFRILRDAGLEPYKELEAAVKKVVEVADNGNFG